MLLHGVMGLVHAGTLSAKTAQDILYFICCIELYDLVHNGTYTARSSFRCIMILGMVIPKWDNANKVDKPDG